MPATRGNGPGHHHRPRSGELGELRRAVEFGDRREAEQAVGVDRSADFGTGAEFDRLYGDTWILLFSIAMYIRDRQLARVAHWGWTFFRDDTAWND